MTKKITALTDFVSAAEAATILSQKFGRTIKPDYIHRLRHVRFEVINQTTKLYHKADIEACTIRERKAS